MAAFLVARREAFATVCLFAWVRNRCCRLLRSLMTLMRAFLEAKFSAATSS